MKSTIKRCCNEGHDVLTAQDMHTALSQHPVSGTSACVCSTDESKRTLEVNKMDAFSRCHNFKFEKNGVRVWKAYGIGPRNLIHFNDLICKKQVSLGLNVHADSFHFKMYESIKQPHTTMTLNTKAFSIALSLAVRRSLKHSASLKVT